MPIKEIKNLISLGSKILGKAISLKWLRVNNPKDFFEEALDVVDKYNEWSNQIGDFIELYKIDDISASLFKQPDVIRSYNGAQTLEQFFGGKSNKEQEKRINEVMRLTEAKLNLLRKLANKKNIFRDNFKKDEIIISRADGIVRKSTGQVYKMRGPKRLKLIYKVWSEKIVSGMDIANSIYGESKNGLSVVSNQIKAINGHMIDKLNLKDNFIIQSGSGGYMINKKFKVTYGVSS